MPRRERRADRLAPRRRTRGARTDGRLARIDGSGSEGRPMQTQTGSSTPAVAHIPPMSTAPSGFSMARDLPDGFAAFYRPLHERFTPRQQAAIAARRAVLADALAGRKPRYPAPSAAQGDWRIELP